MSKRNSKSGWLLYLMVHWPFVWWWKIGITHAAIGADKRAGQIDRAVIGRPYKTIALFIPFAYLIEQDLHRRFSFCHTVWYRGDGHQEWFFLFPILLWPLMAWTWLSYLYGIDLLLGTNLFGIIIGFLLDVIHYLYIYLQQK